MFAGTRIRIEYQYIDPSCYATDKPNSTDKPYSTDELTHGWVEGIIYSDAPSVMIDTQVLKAGDTIHGVTVINILKHDVVFEKNEQRWTQSTGETPNSAWQQP